METISTLHQRFLKCFLQHYSVQWTNTVILSSHLKPFQSLLQRNNSFPFQFYRQELMTSSPPIYGRKLPAITNWHSSALHHILLTQRLLVTTPLKIPQPIHNLSFDRYYITIELPDKSTLKVNCSLLSSGQTFLDLSAFFISTGAEIFYKVSPLFFHKNNQQEMSVQ